MKLFIFLTLISFGSAISIGAAFSDTQSTIDKLTSLQNQTFTTAISDVYCAIDKIQTLLGDSDHDTASALQAVCSQTVGIGNDIMSTLISAIQANGDTNVANEANKAIQDIQTKLESQLQIFEQTADKNASSDQQSQIANIVQELSKQLINDLTPLLQAIGQLTQ